MKLSSPSFREGERIPAAFSCDGQDINPELHIEGVPPGARCLVLVVDDPDATGGVTWDHWVLYDIEPTTTVIREKSAPGTPGMTSFGGTAYGGPCPPKGAFPHRYFFKLYALDMLLGLPEAARKADVEKAMEGHVLERAELIGLFGH